MCITGQPKIAQILQSLVGTRWGEVACPDITPQSLGDLHIQEVGSVQAFLSREDAGFDR